MHIKKQSFIFNLKTSGGIKKYIQIKIFVYDRLIYYHKKLEHSEHLKLTT